MPLIVIGATLFLNMDKLELSIPKALIHIIFQSTFLYGVLYVVKERYTARFLIAFFYTIELFTQLSYGSSLSVSIVMSILNTSTNESLSFIQFNVTPIIISMLFFTGILFLKLPSSDFVRKISVITVIAGLFYIVIPTLVSPHVSLHSIGFTKQFSKAGLAKGKPEYITMFEYYLNDMKFRLRIINSIIAISDTFHFLSFQVGSSSTWSEVISNTSDSNLLVIGIGESLRASNMGIYSYARKTTPKLSSMNDNLNVYKNAYSAGTNTWTSVPASLTKVSPDSKPDISKSIINLAKDAGYQVFWISNQLKTSKWDFSVSAIAKQADHVFFLSEDEAGTEYDLTLVSKLEQLLYSSRNIKKRLFILHYYGSHMKFEDRYGCNSK